MWPHGRRSTAVRVIPPALKEQTSTDPNYWRLPAARSGHNSSRFPRIMYSMVKRMGFTLNEINQIRRAFTVLQNSKVRGARRLSGQTPSLSAVDISLARVEQIF